MNGIYTVRAYKNVSLLNWRICPHFSKQIAGSPCSENEKDTCGIVFHNDLGSLLIMVMFLIYRI